MIPELGSGVWTGVAYGLFGVSLWVIGLYVLYRLLGRYWPDEEPTG